jgi:hypothetical protein
MKKNVGAVDGYIRFLVGISFLLNIIILEPGTIGTVILTVLGISMLYSAHSGYCPLYEPFGFCTCDDNTCCCGCDSSAE